MSRYVSSCSSLHRMCIVCPPFVNPQFLLQFLIWPKETLSTPALTLLVQPRAWNDAAAITLGFCCCCTNLLQHGLFRLKHSSWPSGIPIVPASILPADQWASTAASFPPLCRIAVPRPLLIITQLMIQVMHPGLPTNITLGPPNLVTLHLVLLSSDIPLISLRPPCHLDFSGTPKGKLISAAIRNPESEQSPTYSYFQEDSLATWIEHTRPPGSDRSGSS